MPDPAARSLDATLRRLPAAQRHAYRHLVLGDSPTELNPGERSDVSWISTESVDHAGEVIVARGMEDSLFRLNPLVTLNHDYDQPPVGRSVWRRRVRDGQRVGIKAKTHYPPRPASWPGDSPWLPDQVFALVQAGLLRGKSIGFLPLEVHTPDRAEVARHGWDDSVRLVVDRWLLLEYACVSLPANPHSLVEVVSKGRSASPGFTTEEALCQALARRVAALDLDALVRRAMTLALDGVRGRI
jgi:hypothetical protein